MSVRVILHAFSIVKKEKLMATTNLMPLHPGKDGSIAKAFQRIIGYVENPEKTNNGNLVTAYQCEPNTAASEFTLDKRTYFMRTGKGGGAAA